MKSILASALLISGVVVSTARAADAPEEVVLRINAQGVARVPADRLVGSGYLSATGPTEAAAKLNLQTEVDQMRRKLKDAGIHATVVPPAPINSTFQLVSPPAPPIVATPTMTPSAVPPPLYIRPVQGSAASSALQAQTAGGSVEITVTDAAKLTPDQLATLKAVTAVALFTPSLSDDGVGHEIAVADGLAKARADATLYANGMGFHIVRLKSLGNDTAADARSLLQLFQSFSTQRSNATTVPVFSNVRVEYVIAPN